VPSKNKRAAGEPLWSSINAQKVQSPHTTGVKPAHQVTGNIEKRSNQECSRITQIECRTRHQRGNLEQRSVAKLLKKKDCAARRDKILLHRGKPQGGRT